MKLYEISANYREVLQRLDEVQETGSVMTGDGEILTDPQEVQSEEDRLKSLLDSIEDVFDRKVENCTIMARELEAEAGVLKAEEARLAKRRKAMENRADGVMEYVKACFIAAGKTSLKTSLYSFTLGKPSQVVQVLDLAALPAGYIRIVPESREPDKNAIKKAIQGGEVVPGAQLADGKRSFTVR